ncbi:COX15/CtaA family protein [Piscibacillus salipiscarius]|uniref:COX15/CtaA family protein n=1 Tax=Piscibacillus salipiscarius TaxID=299480 RepID=UPI0034E24D14
MGHRLMAGLLFIWVIGLLLHLYRNYKEKVFIKNGWFIASILITLQVILGALVIFTLKNTTIALMHALFISLFFALLSYFILLLIEVLKKKIKGFKQPLIFFFYSTSINKSPLSIASPSLTCTFLTIPSNGA